MPGDVIFWESWLDNPRSKYVFIEFRIPSGKLTKSDGKIHHFSWENPLFRLGHFQVRKLLVYQRVYVLHVSTWSRDFGRSIHPRKVAPFWLSCHGGETALLLLRGSGAHLVLAAGLLDIAMVWFTSHQQVEYPLVNIQKTMEHHHF